ncbi:TetR/AcrR family transcriptional regulator [Streptomyces sp. ID05-26A]|nr:TetR/AcrR family transcriptional regulator [Streptomyces sp. ID05-26A]
MPSARETELLEAAYRYVLTHGLVAVSLRPLAAAIGSSTRVLLYLFGSKEGLVKALLARARVDELALLADIGAGPGVVARLWEWLSAPAHRPLLTLWLEAYARSLVEPDGPWAGFARATVEDWLEVLRAAQPEDVRDTAAGLAARTRELALLRGALLDLLATGDGERVAAALATSLTA